MSRQPTPDHVELRPDYTGTSGAAFLPDGTLIGQWYQLPAGGWTCVDMRGTDLTRHLEQLEHSEEDAKQILTEYARKQALLRQGRR